MQTKRDFLLTVLAAAFGVGMVLLFTFAFADKFYQRRPEGPIAKADAAATERLQLLATSQDDGAVQQDSVPVSASLTYGQLLQPPPPPPEQEDPQQHGLGLGRLLQGAGRTVIAPLARSFGGLGGAAQQVRQTVNEVAGAASSLPVPDGLGTPPPGAPPVLNLPPPPVVDLPAEQPIVLQPTPAADEPEDSKAPPADPHAATPEKSLQGLLHSLLGQ